jgi:predicted flap endonuclease-1-like 5' DNA nuclease
MGQDEDFDDYDDLDAGFEFEETPVEIDVPAEDTAGAAQDTGGEDGNRLTSVNGIGPAYEARLQALGIESLDDLLNADPASLADQLGVIGGQAAVEDWIAQARQLTSGGGQYGNNG